MATALSIFNQVYLRKPRFGFDLPQWSKAFRSITKQLLKQVLVSCVRQKKLFWLCILTGISRASLPREADTNVHRGNGAMRFQTKNCFSQFSRLWADHLLWEKLSNSAYWVRHVADYNSIRYLRLSLSLAMKLHDINCKGINKSATSQSTFESIVWDRQRKWKFSVILWTSTNGNVSFKTTLCLGLYSRLDPLLKAPIFGVATRRIVQRSGT